MKLFSRTLTFLFVFVVYLGAISYGQDASSVIRVKIPFEFSVGGKTFPAGDYSLVQPMQRFLVLRDSRGQSVASAFTSTVDVSNPVVAPTLRFASVDGRHILTELWQAEDPAGQRLLNAKASTAVARHHSTETRAAAEGSRP
ncbi:MAG TPA: hypothetical protein VLT90_02565 [Terriglobales bacterium]|nr:hypothetical protein [Terriglobales bacterium]